MKVDPIKNVRDVRAIKKMLADRPRDLTLFCVGINTNLRGSDILRLKVKHARDAEEGAEIVLVEKKTSKERRITLNREVAEALRKYFDYRSKNEKLLEDESPLFVGQRGKKALCGPSLSRLVKEWCRDINLKGNYSSHSLRKTFGYHQRVRFDVSIYELMHMFNHASIRQTVDYLCIQPEEIKSAYLNLKY